jgi:membrane associated rhomboid family serine protease
VGWQDRPYNQEDTSGGVPPVVFQFPKLTRLSMSIIGVCLLVFLAQAFTRRSGSPLEYWGALDFRGMRAFTQPWRWITYQYLHGSAGHFFFNMIGLYFFLPSLELMWGWRKAFAFYTAGGIFAGVVFGVMSLFFHSSGLIGASGSIFAALGAVALLNPARQLILLFFPLPIRVAAALFGAFFLLSTIADNDLSSAAHLGGLAFGFFAPYLAGPILKKKMRQYREGRERRARQAERDELADIDRILQKVHDSGMGSLTRGEKKTLARATERQRQADLARARRAR